MMQEGTALAGSSIHFNRPLDRTFSQKPHPQPFETYLSFARIPVLRCLSGDRLDHIQDMKHKLLLFAAQPILLRRLEEEDRT